MLIRCIFEYFQKKRKVLTINKKMEILTNLENGMIVCSLGEAWRARKREALLQGISSVERTIMWLILPETSLKSLNAFFSKLLFSTQLTCYLKL